MSLSKSRFIEMFGDVINNKKTWPTKRWSDVLNIVNGKNQKKVECENGIYPICGSGGEIGKTNEYLTKENSVIIGRKGNINNPILMKTKFWNVDTAFGLEPNNKEINVEYLYKFCELFDFQRLNKTVTIPSLTKSDLLKIEIPVPPMKLQEEYRNFLAQVDKSKFLLQKILEKLELLKKSRFIEMFGRLGCDDKKWGLVSLGEFCLLNPQKSELHNISDDTEVSFLPMSSVSENGELTLSERKLYRDVKSGFSYFAEGDVLFAKITPCMENGKGAVAHGLCNNIGFGSTEFHVLRAKTSVCNPYWLYELLSLKQFRKIAEQNMTGSAGQKRVPAKFLQNFKLSLPPIELQNEYVSISRQIDKSKLVIQKSLEDLVGKS